MTGPRQPARPASRCALADLLAAAEAERGRIADELHDDAVQALTASVMHLSLLEARVPALDEQPAYTSARENLEHGLRAARALLNDLRPPTLAARGVRAAVTQQLERLARRTGCRTRLDWRVPGRLDPRIETVLFRAVQQALPPPATRARVPAVTVAAFPRGGGVTTEVTWTPAGDSPPVLEPAAADPPMAYQHVELTGGTVHPHPGRGGATIWLPLHLPPDSAM